MKSPAAGWIVALALATSCTPPAPSGADAGVVAAKTGRLTGRAVAGGAPSAGAVVELVSARRLVHAGEDGRFTLLDLAPGAWALRLRDSAGRRAVVVATITRGADGGARDAELGDVVLAPDGSIHGSVV